MNQTVRLGWRVARWMLALVAVVVLIPYVLTPLYRFGRPVSTLMLWRSATGTRVERTWIPLEATSPFVPRAAGTAELACP